MTKNRKGFTLIELLAVIVIMGVLMVIAIPLMTRYIENSRKDTFVATAKAYINGARYQYLAGDLNCTNVASGTAVTNYVKLKDIDVENIGNKSSFGKATIDTTSSYVKIVTNSDGTSTYSIAIRDTDKNGIAEIAEGQVDRSQVKKGNIEAFTTGTATCTKTS